MLRLQENPCQGEKFHMVEKKETNCFERRTTNLLRDGPTGTMVGEVGVGIQAGAHLEAVLAYPVRYFTPKS
jgi:hypothetical protein